MKKFCFLLVMALFLQACNKPLDEYLRKEKIKKEFKEKSDNSCPLAYLGEGKDILVANIYFQDNKYTLTAEDNKIISDVASIHAKCPQEILLIGHASNMETEDFTFTNGISLSLNRAKMVAQRLQDN
ncbi:MAG: hypothetical protein LBH40_04900, partial [Alphaproteobacteria bacterium]|nr:hypothetical protein [Alphaproteobacteria bacterium]